MSIGSRSIAAFLVLALMGDIISVEASRDRQLFQAKTACKPGSGGPSCTACKPGTYSLGDTECLKCPPQAMCMSMPGPCQKMPVCDPTSGKATSMCWVNKLDGAACSPGLYGTQPLPAGAAVTHTCQKGACEPVKTQGAGSGSDSVTTSKTSPVRCPSTPLCRMAQGPCDQAPPCDAQGRPTSSCWVAKPDGAQCNPNGGMVNSASPFICRNRQCVMAATTLPAVVTPGPLGNQQRPQILPLGPIANQNRPQILPVRPSQNRP